MATSPEGTAVSQQLTVELPDHVYQSLADEAATAGKTVAEVAGERLAHGPPPFGSRLRKWAGSADSDQRIAPPVGSPTEPLLLTRPGTVYGSLTREEIYDDID